MITLLKFLFWTVVALVALVLEDPANTPSQETFEPTLRTRHS